MTKRGEQHAQHLREALLCPECQYSLRGLLGDEVNCPECGHHVNIPGLMSAKWNKPWWEAPLYNTLALPVIWAFVATLAAMPIGVVALQFEMAREFVLPWIVIGFAIWVAVLLKMKSRFGSAEGIWLALALHLVVPMYLFGIIGTLGMTIHVIMELGALWIVTVYNVLGLSFFVGLVVGARLIERFVGSRCIRRHLRLIAAGDSAALSN